MNGTNDLMVTKIINASPSIVWKAWREPEHFVKWWAPAPVRTVSNRHEFHAGGAFDTTMHLPDGTVMEGGEGCFLEVVENERIVFTDALQGGWRPNETAFFTAIITLEEHPDGTRYTATALHKNDEDRWKHEEMGFLNGWATALDQLAELSKSMR